MAEGRIVQAVRGFWYVETETGLLACAGRGRLRRGETPLVGDLARVDLLGKGKGIITELLPRRNAFVRPAVANLDVLVLLASAAPPVTDPYLLDRMIAIAELKDCEPILCFHKCDLRRAEALQALYAQAGFRAIHTSTVTGEGLDELRGAISGRFAAFSGNSGVGKSSLLNALEPRLTLETDTVSEKLGRGRHTTRTVTIYRLPDGTAVADTPGFAAFDGQEVSQELKRQLPELFREFRPHLGDCRFADCAHGRDDGCAVTAALSRGELSRSRYESYLRLREELRGLKEWEVRN